MLVGLAVAVTVSMAQLGADWAPLQAAAHARAGTMSARAQAPSGSELRQTLRDVLRDVVARIAH